MWIIQEAVEEFLTEACIKYLASMLSITKSPSSISKTYSHS